MVWGEGDALRSLIFWLTWIADRPSVGILAWRSRVIFWWYVCWPMRDFWIKCHGIWVMLCCWLRFRAWEISSGMSARLGRESKSSLVARRPEASSLVVSGLD